jgi:predicted ferric reductase
MALVATPSLVVFIGRPASGVSFWWDFSMGLGLAGMSMIGIQFALTARLRRATAPFGADLVYVFHRYLALIGFALIFSHFAILWLFYNDALGSLDPRIAAWEMTSARVALGAFALAVVTSEFRKTLRLNYGAWRYLHVALALTGLAAAIAHVIGTGRLTQSPVTLALWFSMTAFWAGIVVWMRLVKPWRQQSRPYRVTEVRAERGEAWTLAMEPDGWPGISGFSPGQFAWLSLATSPFALKDHPFSISSTPQDLPRVEMTIKALGDFTREIANTPVGRRAWLDGPFGVFTSDRYPQALGLVFIAGGIGITPVMSMLRTLAASGDRRPIWLFYANPDWEGVTFRDEIDALAAQLQISVIHIVEKPPPGFDGEAGLLDESLLRRHLSHPQLSAFRYFLCGPVPLTEAAERGLSALGVPESHIRTELFELA